MFARNFMKKFPVIKYADVTARADTMNTDVWLVSKQQVSIKRGFVYLGITGMILLMFENFHTADEVFGAATRAHSAPVYERSVPKEVLYPNEEIISSFEAIHRMRGLKETLGYEN